jgi:hypothetical protein
LEYLINKWLILGLILALDDNSFEQIINSLALLLVTSVELDKYGFIGDDFKELLELHLSLRAINHESKRFFEFHS